MNKPCLLQSDERLDLLIRLLSFDRNFSAIGELRLELLNDTSQFEAMMEAAVRRHLLPAALVQLKDKGILPPHRSARTKDGSIVTQLADFENQFKQRRASFGTALHDVLSCLNKVGVQPIVLKGSMSLISGQPEWRFQRDIDFAVEPSEADKTVSALRKVGFRECDDQDERPHHLQPMARDDMPGTLEPHVKLAGSRARAVLPDDVLVQSVTDHVWQGVNYRAMSSAGFLLHGLAHHHFQNRGYIYGTVSLKGLLEFAHTVSRLQETDVLELDRMTATLPRLKAGLQLWYGLATRLLGVRLPPGVTVSSDAEKLADTVSNRHLRGRTVRPFAGVREHVVLSLQHAS
ncbi:MAG: nucleotidyltransferase family protein, partial [Anderseniella sp.]